MVAVALDIAELAVLEMDFDAAAAGAHVAGRVGDLVGAGCAEGDGRIGVVAAAQLIFFLHARREER